MTLKQEKVLKVAMSLLGTPYKYVVKWDKIPKKNPEYISCSSFIQFVFFNAFGMQLEWSTILQAARAGRRVKGREALDIGDLIFFRGSKGHYDDDLFLNEKKRIYIGHVVLYIGRGQVIHASGEDGAKKVLQESLMDIIKIRGPIVLVKRVI